MRDKRKAAELEKELTQYSSRANELASELRGDSPVLSELFNRVNAIKDSGSADEIMLMADPIQERLSKFIAQIWMMRHVLEEMEERRDDE